jgi:hypothetical protein
MNLAAILLTLAGMLATRLGLSGPILGLVNAAVSALVSLIPPHLLDDVGKQLVSVLVKILMGHGVAQDEFPEALYVSPLWPNPMPQVGPADASQPGP